ncbi:MAG: hypothetical protein R3C08_07875 [Hyphomonas sp.]|nr:hypothetical protein [Hyphomonas sp.]HRX75293.1 hypothetical protein [Hyphomonas sp.]
MVNMSGRKAKKSEKIEVRISHEEKRELQVLAQHRGQTVSMIVRDLVTEHLKAARRAELQTALRERTDMILTPARTHPRKLAAALVASLGLGALLMPAAMADPLKVELEGDFQRTGAEFKEQHKFNSTMVVEPGATGTFVTNTPESDVDGYRIELTVSPEEAGRIRIDVSIYRGLEGDDLIAHPILTTMAGEEARIHVGSDAESYEIGLKVGDA